MLTIYCLYTDGRSDLIAGKCGLCRVKISYRIKDIYNEHCWT